jgi:hypothetical protein
VISNATSGSKFGPYRHLRIIASSFNWDMGTDWTNRCDDHHEMVDFRLRHAHLVTQVTFRGFKNKILFPRSVANLAVFVQIGAGLQFFAQRLKSADAQPARKTVRATDEGLHYLGTWKNLALENCDVTQI